MEGVRCRNRSYVPLLIIAAMYSSVGHGELFGYLAVLSLTAYAANDPCLAKTTRLEYEFLVAGIAFSPTKNQVF